MKGDVLAERALRFIWGTKEHRLSVSIANSKPSCERRNDFDRFGYCVKMKTAGAPQAGHKAEIG